MLSFFKRKQASITSSLSDRELKHGAALRIASCCTHGEQEYFIDFRCFYFPQLEGDFDIRVRADGMIPVQARFRASALVQNQRDGSELKEAQFIARVSRDYKTLYVDCIQKSTGLVVDRLTVPSTIWSKKLLEEFYKRACNPFADVSYGAWLAEHRASQRELDEQRRTSFQNGPLFSLISPVYKTPEKYLRSMIDSVVEQSYVNWELIIVNASPDDCKVQDVLALYDDARIRVINHPENDGINGNTNFGIAAARGDYVGFIDHDDFIEPDLLFEYAYAINSNDDVAMLYCDEDSFKEDKGYSLPMFKPDMNIDLLYSNNYLLHLLMVSRDVIENTSRAPEQTNGAQDYDLTLKAYEYSPNIVHVPRVLYHWRIHEKSSNAGNNIAKPYVNNGCVAALNDHFCRTGIDVTVCETQIPYVYKCVPNISEDSLCAQILCDNGAMRNAAAQEASESLILFGMKDTVPLDDDSVQTVSAYFARNDIGMVAPRLMCPDGLSCAQWVVLRDDMRLTYMGYDLPSSDGGYNGRFHRPCDVTAVDGACFMVRRQEFLELGGYDESFQTLVYATVDLCLRYQKRGKLVLFTPFALFEHKQDIVETLMKRPKSYYSKIEHDRLLLKDRWFGVVGINDSLYNANLDDKSPYYLIKHRVGV